MLESKPLDPRPFEKTQLWQPAFTATLNNCQIFSIYINHAMSMAFLQIRGLKGGVASAERQQECIHHRA